MAPEVSLPQRQLLMSKEEAEASNSRLPRGFRYVKNDVLR